MAETTVLGRFVWHELVTTDPAAAQSFYPKVTGWKFHPWEPHPEYTLCVAKAGPVGGVTQLSETARSAGAKPNWLAYIGTPDIEATIEQAKESGGLVVTHLTSIANGGRYAVLADPHGALFGLYTSPDATAPGAPKQGDFSWHELATADFRAAFEFYRALFGWQLIEEHDMGDFGIYLVFGLDGVPKGGVYTKPADMPASWMNYVAVRDAAKAAKAATAAGGRVINGPMEVPGGDWITQIQDPQGAIFAVHARGAAAKPEAAPAESAAPAKPAQSDLFKSPPAEKAASAKPTTPKKPAPAKPAAAAKQATKKKAASKSATKKKPGKKAGKKSASRTAVKKKAATKKKAAAKKKSPAKKAAKKAMKKAATKIAKQAAKKKAARKK